jgi:hypothetical protein
MTRLAISSRRTHLSFVLAVALTLVAVLGTATVASAHKKGHHHSKPSHHSAGGWKWSKPFALPGKPQVDALSCATTTLCVATGNGGNPDENIVFSSTNPSGGTSAWQGATLEPSADPQLAPGGEEELLDGASCETAGMAVDCALSDGWDNFFQTSDPTGGAPAWGKSMPTLIAFVALSCWSAYCGELDVNGDAVITVGAQALSDQNVFRLSEGLSSEPGGISCNASAFCATVDTTNDIAWTTDATGSPATWTTATVPGADLDTIACPSPSLCVASEGQNSASGKTKIGVSTNPAGGASTWKSFDAAGVYRVTCQSTTFCVAVAGQDIYTSTDPSSASAAAWKKSKLPLSADDASCPTATECVVASDGDIAIGTR